MIYSERELLPHGPGELSLKIFQRVYHYNRIKNFYRGGSNNEAKYLTLPTMLNAYL